MDSLVGLVGTEPTPMVASLRFGHSRTVEEAFPQSLKTLLEQLVN